MTMITPHGYPDFGRYAAQADRVLVDVTVPDIDVADVIFQGFVGDVPAVAVLVDAQTGGFDVSLEWATDMTFASVLHRLDASFPDGAFLRYAFPTLGPYLQVTVTPVVANSAYTARLWTSSSYSGTLPGGGFEGFISVSGVSIGAGASRTDRIFWVAPAEATWSVDTTATAWSSLMRSSDSLGTLSTMDRMDPTNAGQRRTIFMPLQEVRIVTTNNDAGAQTFWITMTMRNFGA